MTKERVNVTIQVLNNAEGNCSANGRKPLN